MEMLKSGQNDIYLPSVNVKCDESASLCFDGLLTIAYI